MGDMADDIINRMEGTRYTVKVIATGDTFEIYGAELMYSNMYSDETKYRIIEQYEDY